MKAATPAILFVTRYFWPEPVGSAPFTGDIARRLLDAFANRLDAVAAGH